ncbi:MAG: D-alanyl-D-alanine endopeptidase 1 [Candidatus Magasanikbacteria bacterium GW2011_GWD2_43_18]|nr:MAG: D-alanyl-D-alanine endopeptidase 1 [Candidatus Magasanikbacteria bacterium GW2011_GWC2_42_27]KKT03401.1 MAG: D-alanyl-D-alanine endopeptidase 1 [Candidatus Magasanikbacteria bacterium GW2011_GWD2_43_18]KKT25281.1 MAG: D-alanyl-D-alanine endopeptidase 1 [Candidatus Magasanikbacteria bacterium GW2011_GWA2_43_9]
MNHISKRIFSFVIVLGMVLPQPAFLATTAEFNPNFLLSDEELQAWDTMSRTDIQAFLDERGSFLSTFRTEDKNGVNKLAADIIYAAAMDNKINPKYILVKLQKEQSLITEKNPTQKQLDGATGYGITDGCGWDCATYKNNQGFGKQVDAAAGIMRWYYDNVSTQSWIKRPPLSYTIDGEFITPASLATGFLYTYTPHLQGNKNFWTLWQSWFDQVYPSGTLLKSTNDPLVYLIQDGKKRPFASMTALATRFDPKRIITVPGSELARYDLGKSISLPNYAIVKTPSGSYYLLDYDTKRPFASSDTVGKLGYNPDEILDISEDDLSTYTLGTTITANTTNPFGELVKIKENGALYYIKDNEYHLIYDKAMIKENFPNLTLQTVSIDKLKSYVPGQPVKIKDGTLILVEGDNKVYAVENGKKRHIASEEVFNGLGYDWKNIVTVNEFAGILHETAEPIYLRSDIVTMPAPADTQEQTIPQIDGIPAEGGTEQTTASEDTPTPEKTTLEDLMVKTPKENWTFVGNTFDTEIDAYLVADYATGNILAGKNIDTVRPTASLAKVMTAYMLIQEGLNLNASVVYKSATHKTPPEFHRYRIAEGERVRNSDLLNTVLVSSENTSVRMLVSSVTSDETGFVSKMNAQLRDWGLTKTSLKDVYGGAVENDTTAREYLTIFTKATANGTVKQYMGKASYEYDEMLDLDGLPHHFDDHTNDLMKDKTLSFTIVASKTGYIYESGDNLAMLISRKSDGKQFVIIALGNPDRANRFTAPKALSEWAMKTF